jgi:dynein heavy chain
VTFLTPEEMRINSSALQKIHDELDDAIETGDRLNEEERLLDQEQTTFADLQVALTLLKPYYTLWTLAYDFHNKHKLWFEGPFQGLDAAAIAEDVEQMAKTMYNLGKSFGDQPGPRKVADTVRAKIERFRAFLPLLGVVCNPGLRERHWDQLSDIVGVRLDVTPETTLAEIMETGLGSASPTLLEEISGAATKEHQLEKNLQKMMGEWQDIQFDLIPYRTSGVNILSGLDDIQTMLDDHILKAQTMRGSPFIKPLEKEMRSWEEKLLGLQDILEEWVKVQSTWMYLEPIFSSPDIIKQMPTEAKKFHAVDKTVITHSHFFEMILYSITIG